MNQQTVALGREIPVRADERFRGGALQERARLRVHRRAEEVAIRGVSDVEMDGAVE